VNARRYSINRANCFIPTRQSLLSRLKDAGDQESWRVFFETYWRLIYRAAARAGLSDDEAQDVVQDTVLAMVRRMPGFHYDPAKGLFKNWLLQATQWQIVTQLRRRKTHIQSPRPEPRFSARETQTATIEQVADPAGSALETIWDEEWEDNLLAAALERVKKKIDPKQYQAYDLYVLNEVPASRVARALRINLAQVYLAKHRTNKLLRVEISYLRNKPV